MGDVRKRAGVSARQSHGKETSVEDQVRAGRGRCDQLGATVIQVYRDKVSASRFGTKPRDDWPRLVGDVKAGALDLVWLWDASRGDRNPETWFPFLSACRDRGVLIYLERDRHAYDVRIPRDWKTLADSGVDAAYDSEIKSADVRRGVAGAALAGKAHGRAAYGLTRVYNPLDRKQFTQEPNDQAPVAKEIIERVAANDPIVLIERDLNERGVPPPAWEGIPAPLRWWRRNTIRNIARNPAYAGLRGHNGTIHPGNWPGIVDLETWWAAQAVLDDDRRKTTAPGAFRWLLSYLACGQCGGHLHAVPARQAHKPRYTCHRDGCSSIGVWEFDECVTELVLARLAQPDARAVFEDDDEQVAAARQRVAELAVELEDARDSFAQPGGISAAALAKKEHVLLPLIADAQRRITRTAVSTAALSLLSVAEARERLRPAWDALSIAARRSVIDALITEIRIQPADERLTRWSTDDHRKTLAAQRTVITWRS